MPAPRPRARAILPKGGRKPIATIYNPSEYTAWKDAAKEMILEDLEGYALPLRGPLTVGLIVTGHGRVGRFFDKLEAPTR